MKKMLNITIVFIIFSLSLFAENKYNFQPTNGPYGGLIWSFCYDSTTKNIYANSDKIYKLNKSTNKWEIQFDSIYKEYYRSYQLIYADSIYLVSFNKGQSDVSWGDGLFRSSDKGESWEEIKDFNDDVRRIVKLGNIYFAVTAYSTDCVLKSTDYGKSWISSNIGIDSSTIRNGSFYDLDVLKSPKRHYLFLLQSNNIFRSADSGKSWQNITENISPYKQYFWDLTATIDNKIFIASDSTVFTSNDYGDTWQKITNGIDNKTSFNFYYLISDKEGNVYGGGYGIDLYILRKNENTWEKFNSGLIPNYTLDIDFDYSENKAYCATDQGIYKAKYLDQNWEFYNKGIFTPIEINCLAINKNGEVFAGSDGNGIYFSSDKGENWEVRNKGITIDDISKIKIDSKGNIYAVSHYGNIFKSSDNGLNWTKLNLGISNLIFYINDLAINSDDLLITFIVHNDKAQSDFMIISKDGGNNWEKINIPVNYVYAGVFDNNDNLFMAADSEICRTSNNGTSWEQVFKSNKNIGVTSFFVSMKNDIFFSTWKKYIYRSTDGGDSWVDLSNGLPDDVTISCIASPDIENRIVAGSHYDGYFVSKDNGDTWEKYDANFPPNDYMMRPFEFRELAYNHNGTMYAANYSGVYKWDAITTVEKFDNEKSNSLIIPNPTTDYITINIPRCATLQKCGTSEIEIYDVMGMKIQSTPFNLTPTLSEGEGARIDVSNLAPGVYFVKIGDRVEKFVKY